MCTAPNMKVPEAIDFQEAQQAWTQSWSPTGPEPFSTRRVQSSVRSPVSVGRPIGKNEHAHIGQLPRLAFHANQVQSGRSSHAPGSHSCGHWQD